MSKDEKQSEEQEEQSIFKGKLVMILVAVIFLSAASFAGGEGFKGFFDFYRGSKTDNDVATENPKKENKENKVSTLSKPPRVFTIEMVTQNPTPKWKWKPVSKNINDYVYCQTFFTNKQEFKHKEKVPEKGTTLFVWEKQKDNSWSTFSSFTISGQSSKTKEKQGEEAPETNPTETQTNNKPSDSSNLISTPNRDTGILLNGTTDAKTGLPVWKWSKTKNSAGQFKYCLGSVTSQTSYTPQNPLEPGAHELAVAELKQDSLSQFGMAQVTIQAPAFSWAGTVMNAETNKPIEGVKINILKPGILCYEVMSDDEVLVSTSTSKTGEFTFDVGLESTEKYSVCASKEGYKAVEIDEISGEQSFKNISKMKIQKK